MNDDQAEQSEGLPEYHIFHDDETDVGSTVVGAQEMAIKEFRLLPDAHVFASDSRHNAAYADNRDNADRKTAFFLPKGYDSNTILNKLLDAAVQATDIEEFGIDANGYSNNNPPPTASTYTSVYCDPIAGEGRVVSLGDSPAYHIHQDANTGEVTVRMLNEMHAPVAPIAMKESNAEYERVIAEGGEIDLRPGRLRFACRTRHDTIPTVRYNFNFLDKGNTFGLAGWSQMTRALGLTNVPGISKEPFSESFSLKSSHEGDRDFILVASDGLDKAIGTQKELQEIFDETLKSDPNATVETLKLAITSRGDYRNTLYDDTTLQLLDVQTLGRSLTERDDDIHAVAMVVMDGAGEHGAKVSQRAMDAVEAKIAEMHQVKPETLVEPNEEPRSHDTSKDYTPD